MTITELRKCSEGQGLSPHLAPSRTRAHAGERALSSEEKPQGIRAAAAGPSETLPFLW